MRVDWRCQLPRIRLRVVPAAVNVETQEVVDEVNADLLFDNNALDISGVQVEENSLDPDIFRAYDIRGIVGDSLTVPRIS